MSPPQVKEIDIQSLAKHTSGIPHLERTFAHPPGFNKPELYQKWGLYESNEIFGAIEQSELPDAGKTLLNGLLKYGGVGMFGVGENYDLGVDYDKLLKQIYRPEIAVPVQQELAKQMRERTDEMGICIHGVLAPETSGLKPSTTLSDSLMVANVSVNKKDVYSTDDIAVAVDSYSKGKVNIISLAKSVLQTLQSEGKTNFILSDDIIDSGLITIAVAVILQLAHEQGYNINLVGIVTPIEKVYTGASKIIQENLGLLPIVSLLKVEDIGILNEAQGLAWIKIIGLDKAIPCNLRDLRV